MMAGLKARLYVGDGDFDVRGHDISCVEAVEVEAVAVEVEADL